MKLSYLILNIAALLFIYFIPNISMALNFPLYLIEPMRIMVILAIVHTSKKNAYLLAIVLPLFSFFIASHPSLAKTIILSGDLLLNIFLFYFLIKNIPNKFIAMGIGIVAAKCVYYLSKFVLINSSIIEGELISTPLYYQAAIVIVLSGYVYFIDKLKKIKN